MRRSHARRLGIGLFWVGTLIGTAGVVAARIHPLTPLLVIPGMALVWIGSNLAPLRKGTD